MTADGVLQGAPSHTAIAATDARGSTGRGRRVVAERRRSVAAAPPPRQGDVNR